MNIDVLSARALNRALLHRQMLLERSDLPLTEVVEGMGGIQNQYAPAGYIGLWSRMREFERPMLTRALEERQVIQGTLMRATIHVVSAADYWPMMAGIERINREWYAKVQVREIGDTDLDQVVAAARDELADGPLRINELTERLVGRGFPARAAAWASFSVPMVRVPPSGTWDRRRADIYGLAEAWLPRPEITEEQGIEMLIRRYLGAFGPAPLKDIAVWMGLNVGQMRHVADRMELRPFRDANGKPLVDLPDAPLPDPDLPAPPRFLAVWDALLLVHARRTQVLPEELRPLIFNTKTPHSHNTFLLDGQVAGTWRFDDGEIQLSPMRPLVAAERAELEEEAHRLAVFHKQEGA
jgi:hypothetical protein